MLILRANFNRRFFYLDKTSGSVPLKNKKYTIFLNQSDIYNIRYKTIFNYNVFTIMQLKAIEIKLNQ